MPNIEQLAINAVTDLVGRCPRLSDYITSNDKTPLTDGHIDLHSAAKKSNANVVGRVPVQVKGRVTERKVKQKKKSTKFSVAYDVLRFLRDDGGGIYFYVSMRPDGKKREVFYCILLPYKIDRILRGRSDGQKTFAIKLDRLPSDTLQIERIVALALEGRKQGKTSGSASALLEQMQSITIHSIDGINLDRPTVLNLEHTDFAVTIRTAEGLSFPIDIDLTISPGSYSARAVEVPISCGDIEYLRPVVTQTSEESGSFKLSEGLSISLSRGIADRSQLDTNIELTLSGSLRAQLKDVSFYLAALRGNPLVINGDTSRESSPDRGEEKQILRLRDELLRLVEFFEYLKLDDRLVEALQPSDWDISLLLSLHQGLVSSEELAATTDGFGRYDFKVGAFKIVTLVRPGSSEGHRRLVNPFDPNDRNKYRIHWTPDDSEIEKVEGATFYDSMKIEDFAETLNLRLDAIGHAYDSLENRAFAVDAANQTTLNLLAAADTVAGPWREYLLSGACTLTEWAIANGEDVLIYKINRWQALSRLDALSADDRREIRANRRASLKSQVDNAALREACLVILLEDAEELTIILKDLAEADRKLLRSWPIWALTESFWDAERRQI